jgi:Protein of unknown function (DUF2950)
VTRKVCLFVTALGFLSTVPCMAQQRFETPEEAAQAVIDAAGDHDSVRLTKIFGPGAKEVLTSGDSAQDRAEQDEFSRLARAKHRLEISPMNPNRAVLAIGDEDWPFPIPLLRTAGKWMFNPSDAPIEMRARRIGTDELDAIEICHGYVDAQLKYASEDRNKDGTLQYAARLMSTPGHHDGLFWPGETEPLIPEDLARAAWGGTTKGSAKPYHGYYFRVLQGQGSNAPEGEHNYLAKGKLIGGFGLVGWPAEYGVTGIHTFIVNQDGVVYQKDISPVPGKTQLTITRYGPDRSWGRAE